MAFVRRQSTKPDEVAIELEIVNDEVHATVIAPAAKRPPLRLLSVPLREAVVTAIRLSQRFNADIVVIDQYDLWPE